jgi:hypothetical protein
MKEMKIPSPSSPPTMLKPRPVLPFTSTTVRASLSQYYGQLYNKYKQRDRERILSALVMVFTREEGWAATVTSRRRGGGGGQQTTEPKNCHGVPRKGVSLNAAKLLGSKTAT